QVAVAVGAELLDQWTEAGGVDAAGDVLAVDAQRLEGGVVDGGRAAPADVGAEDGGADHPWPFGPFDLSSFGAASTVAPKTPSRRRTWIRSPGATSLALWTRRPSARWVRLKPRSST